MSEKIKPVNDSDLRVIKRAIAVSRDNYKIGKQFMLFILSKSKNLSKRVKVELPEKVASKVMNTVSDMNSVNGKTFLWYIMKGAGSELAFGCGSGWIWIAESYDSYSFDKCEVLSFDIEDIKKISLEVKV